MSPQRSIIAGGAGFLGSHLVDLCIERGDEVIAVDDCSTGTTANIAHLAGHDRFTFIEHDVVEPGLEALVDDVWRGVRATRVANLASPASPPEYLRRPLDTLAVGSTGTRRLLDLAVSHEARFFLASTSEVYGDPVVHPQPESYWGNVNPIGERSVYDEAKRFAEALTMAYHRSLGLDIRIARIFNTYGPRMQAGDGRVVTNFVNQALAGTPLTIFGDGTQTRSFCYVDDEVRGLLALFEGPIVGPVNIGNPVEFTVLELARLTLELTGSSSSIERRPLPSDDPKLRKPDISIATDTLGWTPSVDLRTGLSRTVEWFRAADNELATVRSSA